ncbi:MAG: hypothetical protein IJ065_06110 [Eubacterium sp.]|nr:hypothetical protein [Eubacterium sp.]
MHIDILNYEITIDGKELRFPMSYEEVKSVMGEASRVLVEDWGTLYMYDDQGMIFEDQNSPMYLKKQKAYIDEEHKITSVSLYVNDKQDLLQDMRKHKDPDYYPHGLYKGNLTFCGYQPENKYFNNYYGCYQAYVTNSEGESEFAHVGAYIRGEDADPNYDGDRLLKNVIISFKPRRPKSTENYNIEQPDEECLFFDNFNFKLAVIQELMYEQEVLKPYFDIYDYAKFKKAKWNLDTIKNVRGAVNFFKELPIPVSMAEKVERILMDGGNNIYLNIAPCWDGEDERFYIDKLSEAELKQFPNLKKMTVMTTDIDKLKKVCEPLGIEVERF